MKRRYTLQCLAYQGIDPHWEDTEDRFWTYRGAKREAARRAILPGYVRVWRVLRDGKPRVEIALRDLTAEPVTADDPALGSLIRLCQDVARKVAAGEQPGAELADLVGQARRQREQGLFLPD